MSGHQTPSRPRDPLVQIDITFALPRQAVWLLAGAAISRPHTVASMVEKIGHLLQAVAG